MPAPEEKNSVKEEPDAPALPASYFQELLDTPSCKSKGYCDDCGKCER